MIGRFVGMIFGLWIHFESITGTASADSYLIYR